MTETWKPIPNWPEYAASNQGRIKRVATGQGARPGHFLRPQQNGHGYHKVTLCRDTHKEQRTIHELVALAFIGQRPTGHWINHKDGHKLNNNADNLEYITPRQNAQHAITVLKRYVPRGEAKSKLRDTDIRAIRKRRQNGERLSAIARDYNITPNQAGRICNRLSWTHVT